THVETRLDKFCAAHTRRRQECRRGTHECVLHACYCEVILARMLRLAACSPKPNRTSEDIPFGTRTPVYIPVHSIIVWDMDRRHFLCEALSVLPAARAASSLFFNLEETTLAALEQGFRSRRFTSRSVT